MANENEKTPKSKRHRNPNRRPSGVRGPWGSKAPDNTDDKTLPWERRLVGFPPGVTVEDLAQYRRRPAPLRPPDNLYPNEGCLLITETEYTRCFQAPSPGPQEMRKYGEFGRELKESEDPAEDGDEDDDKKIRQRRQIEDEVNIEDEYLSPPVNKEVAEKPPDVYQGHRSRLDMERRRDIAMQKPPPDQFIVFLQAKKAELMRRPTSLTMEGEFLVRESELRSKYKGHEGAKRSENARRSTSLKLEGEIERESESKLKYVEHPHQPRRHSKRVSTGLKMEGEFQKKSESTTKYIQFPVTERLELLRRPTSLRLEGDVLYSPEYQDTYRDFKMERPLVRKSTDCLKMEGGMDSKSETMSQFLGGLIMGIRRPDGQFEPIVDYNSASPGERRHYLQRKRLLKNEAESKNEKDGGNKDSDKNLEPGDQNTLVQNLENLKLDGSKEINNTFKDTFVDIRPTITSKQGESLKSDGNVNRKKSLLHLPEAQFSKPEPVVVVRNKKSPSKKPVPHQPMTSLRLEGRMETNPEYSSCYLDFPRERPVTRKPPCQIRRPDIRKSPNVSEKHSQYVQHQPTPRTESLRRRSNLRPEGEMDIYPVYRKDYVDYAFNENLASRLTPRPDDEGALHVVNITRARSRPTSPSKCAEVTDSKTSASTTTTFESEGAQCKDANVMVGADEKKPEIGNYAAFEVIEKGGLKGGVGGKPPTDRGRRQTSGASVRRRSQSPSYRLLVNQADENGNVRPKSPFRARSPSPQRTASTMSIHTTVSVQPPTPQLATPRQPSPMGIKVQSFVVLDDNNNNNKHNMNGTLPRRNLRNKFLDLPNPPPTAGKTSSETNWMPPWYQMPTTL